MSTNASVLTQRFGSCEADIDGSLSAPPGTAVSLQEAIYSGQFGRQELTVERGCDGDACLVSAQSPALSMAVEVMRLERGIWLVFGDCQSDLAITQWHRQDRMLTFGTVLRGAGMIASASAPQQRSYFGEGQVIGTACSGEAIICRHTPPRVRCQGVTLLFDGDESLERFGLDPGEVHRWLGLHGSSLRSGHTGFQSAVGTPNALVLKAAQAILWARFTGSKRRLYLRSKAGELMCHLLSAPAGDYSGIEVQVAGPRTDDSLAAIAYAALSDPEDCPEVSELAKRLQVSTGRLIAAFKSKYGISPREHMVAVRMSRARRLIRQTRTPLLDVALACGYEHHSSFTTAYRRTFGETPVETRRSTAITA